MWVSPVILGISELGLNEYIEDFELHREEEKIKEAVIYCMNQNCVGHVITYCQDCNKNKAYSGKDV